VNPAAPTIAAWVTDACPGVAARVAAGRPNADDRSFLMDCPRERSTAFIAYLRSIKSSADLAPLDEPFWFASRFQHGDVYNALSALAADRSASSVTRSLSLQSLIHQGARIRTRSTANTTCP